MTAATVTGVDREIETGTGTWTGMVAIKGDSRATRVLRVPGSICGSIKWFGSDIIGRFKETLEYFFRPPVVWVTWPFLLQWQDRRQVEPLSDSFFPSLDPDGVFQPQPLSLFLPRFVRDLFFSSC